MQVGLLGKTNVGKSTFFSAATETVVQIGNYPFTTIEPNVGIAYVHTDCACKFFDIPHKNSLCLQGTRLIPVKLVDIAGLVPGAHEGKGLGNQFLDDSRQAEVLIHVVDISGSTDIQGQPVPIGTHDPLEDIEFVENEFDHWFKQILEREWGKLTKEIEQKTTKLVDGIAKRFSGLGIKEYEISYVLQNLDLLSKKTSDWSDLDLDNFVKALRKKTKPMLLAANKTDLCKDLAILNKIKERSVVCSADLSFILFKIAKSLQRSALFAAISIGFVFLRSILTKLSRSKSLQSDVFLLNKSKFCNTELISYSLIPKPLKRFAIPSTSFVVFCSISFVNLPHSRSKICLN